MASRNSDVRTENWELNQIANNSGSRREVLEDSFRGYNHVEEGGSTERESQRVAEMENEENEVSREVKYKTLGAMHCR